MPVTLMVVGFVGSPPRAWGQYVPGSASGALYRFTPTGVGTIQCAVKRASRATVHPHGRGDNGEEIAMIRVDYGSPPRAWGQLC